MTSASHHDSGAALLYREHGPMLRALMQSKFRVPGSETESLLHEIFLSYLNAPQVQDPKAWLIGAACHASRYYHRKEQRESGATIDGHEDSGIAESHRATLPLVEGQIAVDQLMEQLPASAKEVLRLHYLEGLSGPEIAARYGTSTGYAEVLIHRSLAKARAILHPSKP